MSCSRKFCKQSAETLDQMERSSASDLVLHGLPMSHKRTLGLNGLRRKEIRILILIEVSPKIS